MVKQKRSNTASWVDEAYAKRLARQAGQTLDAEGSGQMLRLAPIRRSAMFLREARVRIGPGFKMGWRVWHLDTPVPQAEIDKYAPGLRTLSGIRVFASDFDDKRNFRMGSLLGDDAPPLVNVSQHALERLFARLRTNALDDVVREALIPLSHLGQPSLDDVGREVEIELPGVGRMPASVAGARDVSSTPIGAFWQIKTFIPLPLS